jgi:glucose-6-phosphate isomerase
MLPIGVSFDPVSGEVSPATGRYEKRLSELRGIYQDTAAFDAVVDAQNDPLAYRVVEYRQMDNDVCAGITLMQPGVVGDEFFMTRGHFHQREDCGEVYYTQSGVGLLLLESRSGETRTVEMRAGICAYIPPAWAHRSINTGTKPLSFVWVCNPHAGHDYGEILKRGMRTLVVRRDGRVVLEPNPNFRS